MADNPNMKKNHHLSKRRCRYRIVLEVQTEEITDKQKKLHVLIQESSIGVQTQLIEKSSDNLELGILQFYSGGPMVYLNENYCFPRFQRASIIFQGRLDFLGGGGQDAISIETHRTYD